MLVLLVVFAQGLEGGDDSHLGELPEHKYLLLNEFSVHTVQTKLFLLGFMAQA